MTLAWFHWWWDPVLGLPRAQVIVGLTSVVLGFALGALAVWIAKRQKDMQTEQHDFFREQQAHRPDVQLHVTGMQMLSVTGTCLSLTARNGGRAHADGFSWEIVLPESVRPFVQFRTSDNKPTPFKATTDVEKGIQINYFKKEIHEGKLFVGDMIDVAWIVIDRREFEPFEIRWRIYGQYSTEPDVGYNTISVKPRPEGLLNVTPVLKIP